MTKEQALALKPGDNVFVSYRSNKIYTVDHVDESDGFVFLVHELGAWYEQVEYAYPYLFNKKLDKLINE